MNIIYISEVIMIPKFNTFLIPMISIIIFLLSCSGGEIEQKKISYSSLKDVPDPAWARLSEKIVFFGHQSVGFNILDGVKDLMKEYPRIKLNIVETKDSKDFDPGVFAHARIGENLDPKSKIDDFVKVLENGAASKVDAAAMKFCYVDMKKDTDIVNIFNDYKTEIEKIRKKYPDLIIIHFSTPLTVSKTTWKTWIKKVLGKKDFWEFGDNVKRNQYNELLMKEYQGKDPILDIAKIESTKPDGSRQSFELNGRTYYSMVAEYTYDGGHLNEIGRKKVAEQFLLILANL